MSGITELKLWEIGISDLTGIEDFTSLKCGRNQLASLEVSNYSLLFQFHSQSNPLTCIIVNQTQLDNIPTSWEEDLEDFMH